MAMTNTLATRLHDDPFLRNFRNLSVGFDKLFEEMLCLGEPQNYPPYNIVQIAPHSYQIEVALAGFKKTDIQVLYQNGTLTIRKNRKSRPNVDDDTGRFEQSKDGKCASKTPVEYVYRGISKRDFELKIKLNRDVKIDEATMEDGILVIKFFEVAEIEPNVIEIA